MIASSAASRIHQDRFGPYRVVRSLGEGGMGKVFEGRHVALGTRVAIKVLSPVGEPGEAAVRRILREGRAAAAVRHPHIVSVLDVGRAGEAPYLVMEFLEGEDLAHYLSRSGPLSAGGIADMLLPILSGMWAVHEAGVIHRDLKPSNVFLARRHRGVEPVVVDFGISRLSVLGDAGASSGNVMAGTVAYMAPEQVRGSTELTAKTDQYALGAVAYECATGGTMFWGEDTYELLHAIMTAPIVPPSELNPRIPKEFDAVVLRALARDPGDRFADVRAFGEALSALASDTTRGVWRAEFGEDSPCTGTTAAIPEARSAVTRRASSMWLAAAGAAIALSTPLVLSQRSTSTANTTESRPVPSVAPEEASSAKTLLRSPASPPDAPTAQARQSEPPPAPKGKRQATAARPAARAVAAPSPPAPAAPPAHHAPAVERGTADIPIVE